MPPAYLSAGHIFSFDCNTKTVVIHSRQTLPASGLQRVPEAGLRAPQAGQFHERTAELFAVVAVVLAVVDVFVDVLVLFAPEEAALAGETVAAMFGALAG